ncbi:MAG: cytochrome b [Alphaproteobacteria bacterium]
MTVHKYTKVAILLHWMIAVLIIGQIAGGLIMTRLDPAPFKFEVYQLHKSFGLIILLLSLVRLVWRLTHKSPALPAGMSGLERIGAKLTHFGFYGLMIGIPLAGWIMVSASVTQISTKIFKIVPWPDFPGVTRSEAFGSFMKDVHEYMAYAAIVLLVLHVGAALKHHFKDKDDVLTRMLPFLKSKG